MVPRTIPTGDGDKVWQLSVPLLGGDKAPLERHAIQVRTLLSGCRRAEVWWHDDADGDGMRTTAALEWHTSYTTPLREANLGHGPPQP